MIDCITLVLYARSRRRTPSDHKTVLETSLSCSRMTRASATQDVCGGTLSNGRSKKRVRAYRSWLLWTQCSVYVKTTSSARGSYLEPCAPSM